MTGIENHEFTLDFHPASVQISPMGIIYKSSPGAHMELLCCTDPFEFKPHIHNRYVVWLNTGCGEYYRVKGATDILQTGRISVFEPGLVHANHPALPDRRCLRSFYIDPEFFHDLSEQMENSSRNSYFPRHCFKDTESWKRLSRLHDRMLTCPMDLSVDTEIIEAFSLLLAHHGHQTPKYPNDTCDRRVKTIIDCFHAQPDMDFRLNDLAQMAGCTEFHLIRLFRQHMGLSPHALFVQIRLEHARQRLEEGDSIAQAALESGFSDQSHLTRRFKLRYGLTPKKYLTCRKK